MNDDLEQLLSQHSPGEPDVAIRSRVLTAVAHELTSARKINWNRRAAWAVAALLLVGICLNIWAYRADRQRLAKYFDKQPSQAVLDVADAIESVTDRPTRELVQAQLEAAWQQRTVQATPEQANVLRQL